MRLEIETSHRGSEHSQSHKREGGGDEDGPVREAGQGDGRTREKKKAAIAFHQHFLRTRTLFSFLISLVHNNFFKIPKFFIYIPSVS